MNLTIYHRYMVTVWATSAMDISNNVLTGRPYGGTGILYKRKIAHSVTVADTGEPRTYDST